MTKDEIKTYLSQNCFDAAGHLRTKRITPEIQEAIAALFGSYHITYTYCLMKNLEPKRCLHCGIDLKIRAFGEGYTNDFCSLSHSKLYGPNRERHSEIIKAKSKERVRKTRESNLKKYGVDWVSKTEGWRSKQSEIMTRYYSERYEEFITRRKETYRARYGVDFYSSTEEFKRKLRETSRERYGVDSVFQLERVREMTRETLVRLYGVTSPLKNPEIMQRKLNTTKELYGAEHFFQSPYYVEHYNFGGMMTKPQMEVSDFLSTLNLTHTKNDRSVIAPLEVDIFIPEKKIAIEINGAFWHSKDRKDSSYHLNKTEQALGRGITLLHFWDSEIESGLYKEVILRHLEGRTSDLSGELDRRHYPTHKGRMESPRLVSVGPYECWDCGSVFID